MKQGTQSWCTGTTQRDGMGRWCEGGLGWGWGSHVHPWLIHVNVWQKPPQYCKEISLQLKFKKKKDLGTDFQTHYSGFIFSSFPLFFRAGVSLQKHHS